MSSQPLNLSTLLHHRERQIIPIAARVTHLELVHPGSYGRAIRQIGEAATDRGGGGVTKRSEDFAGSYFFVPDRVQIKLCSSRDRNSVRYHLVSFGFLRVQLPDISAIAFKGECALNG